jgi:hypothetical protein
MDATVLLVAGAEAGSVRASETRAPPPRKRGIFASLRPRALLSEVCARGGHVRQATIRKLLPAAYAEAVCCAVQSDPTQRFAGAQRFFESFALNAPLREAQHTDL